jgi:hypothetical protein
MQELRCARPSSKEEAVPQARSSGSKSSTSGTKRASASKSTGAKKTTRKTTSAKSSASKPRAARSTASKSSSARTSNGRASAGAADPRLDAVAQRVRKLNERIIDESKSAGEATLTAYEKALKAIAASLERGPGKSDVEWVSSLATTQAKWIRDITAAWTAAARGVLK